MNAEHRPLAERLPQPPRPPYRPAPLPVTGPRSIRRVLHELCAGARQEWVMVLDQATAANGPGARLPAAWPGAELRALDGMVLVRHAVPAAPGEGSMPRGPGGTPGTLNGRGTPGTLNGRGAPGSMPQAGASRLSVAGCLPMPTPEQGPLRLVVVDRSAALVPLHPGRTFADGALLVRDPAVTASMHAMCATLWQQARPLPPADSGPPPELLPVLDVLLQGCTDAAAAKRLGVSARTYSRRVAQLLHALGVTSRAQAGAAAMAKGWISSRPG